MTMLKKAFQWFAYSSVNPTKVSLTAKSGAKLLLVILGWFGVVGPELEEMIGQVPGNVVNIVAGAYAVAQGVKFLFGLGRKIYLTYIKNHS